MTKVRGRARMTKLPLDGFEDCCSVIIVPLREADGVEKRALSEEAAGESGSPRRAPLTFVRTCGISPARNANGPRNELATARIAHAQHSRRDKSRFSKITAVAVAQISKAAISQRRLHLQHRLRLRLRPRVDRGAGAAGSRDQGDDRQPARRAAARRGPSTTPTR